MSACRDCVPLLLVIPCSLAATVNFETGTVVADVGLPEEISFLPAGTLKSEEASGA